MKTGSPGSILEMAYTPQTRSDSHGSHAWQVCQSTSGLFNGLSLWLALESSFMLLLPYLVEFLESVLSQPVPASESARFGYHMEPGRR